MLVPPELAVDRRCLVSDDNRREIEAWIQQVDDWQRLLAPRFPDIDAHDLRMILRSMFQPKSVPRRWLLRKTEDGRYVL